MGASPPSPHPSRAFAGTTISHEDDLRHPFEFSTARPLGESVALRAAGRAPRRRGGRAGGARAADDARRAGAADAGSRSQEAPEPGRRQVGDAGDAVGGAERAPRAAPQAGRQHRRQAGDRRSVGSDGRREDGAQGDRLQAAGRRLPRQLQPRRRGLARDRQGDQQHHGAALHLRRQAPADQGDDLFAREGHRRRGVRRVPFDPRAERDDGHPPRTLPQDRRDAGRRRADDADLRAGCARPRRGPLHHPPLSPRAHGRGRGVDGALEVQDEGGRHHGVRAVEPPHHHRDGIEPEAADADRGGDRRRRVG